MSRIVKQIPLSSDAGILTIFDDDTIEIRPYTIDEEGQEYIDLDPNKEIF